MITADTMTSLIHTDFGRKSLSFTHSLDTATCTCNKNVQPWIVWFWYISWSVVVLFRPLWRDFIKGLGSCLIFLFLYQVVKEHFSDWYQFTLPHCDILSSKTLNTYLHFYFYLFILFLSLSQKAYNLSLN